MSELQRQRSLTGISARTAQGNAHAQAAAWAARREFLAQHLGPPSK